MNAYASLRRLRPELKLPQLVLAGKRGWLDKEIFRAAGESKLKQDILFTGYVPEDDLPALFSGALCFAYPSYFEGFGLPVLEAMQCGAPVIAGNRTSLPEVVGEAGILVDPFSEEEIAQALAKIIESPVYGDELRVKGIARAKLFDWKRTAQLTLEAYQRAGRKQ